MNNVKPSLKTIETRLFPFSCGALLASYALYPVQEDDRTGFSFPSKTLLPFVGMAMDMFHPPLLYGWPF
jgi:hypothetical protein